MQTVWKGAISFGLVHVPVKMFTATEDKDIHFRQLHKALKSPIKYSKTCANYDGEVKTDDIIRGFEYEKDQYVIISDEELEAIKPETIKTIQILDFVNLTDIDPIYFVKPYYLAPDMSGAGPYSLLLEAIKQTGKIGIAQIAIRNKSSLAAIRVVDNCICLETMHFPDEIRPIAQVPNIPAQTNVNDKELTMAKMLINQLSVSFDATKYTDVYRIALQQLIQDKIAGKSPDVVNAPAADRANVLDLMAALQASLEATKSATPNKTKRTKRETVS